MKQVLLVLTMLLGFTLICEPIYCQKKRNGQTRSDESPPKITDVIPVMIPPQTINLDEVKSMIGYPRKAQEQKIEGTVHVRILVDKEGDYVKHQIMSTPHQMLSSIVNKHIGKIVFTPAIDNDRNPVMYWTDIPVHFQLKRKNKGRFRRN